MSEMTFEDAAAALQSAGSEPSGGDTPTPGSPAAALAGTSNQPSPTPGGDAPAGTTPNADPSGQTPAAEDSFTNIDPASLSPELRQLYQGMQSDYTRKMQSVAPFRQLAEQGVDPERVTQALEFVQNLETDPDFVRNVHAEITQALEQAGLSPLDAHNEATRQMEAGFEDPESELAKEVAELRQWRQEQERVQLENRMAADIQRQEMAIRQMPDKNYNDSDIARIYELAFAHAGDLIAAERSYASQRDAIISSYLSQKEGAAAEVPVSAVGGSAPTHSETPLENPLDWNSARMAARDYLRNVLGQ